MDLVEIPFGEEKITGSATTSVRSATLEPMALPKDKIGLPSIAEVIPTIISGSEVATATIKKLMVYAEIPIWREILVEELIKSFTA